VLHNRRPCCHALIDSNRSEHTLRGSAAHASGIGHTSEAVHTTPPVPLAHTLLTCPHPKRPKKKEGENPPKSPATSPCSLTPPNTQRNDAPSQKQGGQKEKNKGKERRREWASSSRRHRRGGPRRCRRLRRRSAGRRRAARPSSTSSAAASASRPKTLAPPPRPPAGTPTPPTTTRTGPGAGDGGGRSASRASSPASSSRSRASLSRANFSKIAGFGDLPEEVLGRGTRGDAEL